MSRNRRLAVLLVTSSISKEDHITTIGSARPLFSDPEFVDYAELLSASNIPFDIIEYKDINYETFVENNSIKYAVIIITIPFHLFSDKQVSILKDVSYDSGVSLIASYTNVDKRSYSFFGIKAINKKSLLWPLKVKIVHWPRDLHEDEIMVHYGLITGLPGIRKRGINKLYNRSTFIKCLRMIRCLILPFARMSLESGTRVLVQSIKDAPLAWSSQFGKATNYYFALHGDLFLDQFNEMHRLVRAAIEVNSGSGMVSMDLNKTMVLRMDDPGSCSADYFNDGKLMEEKDWKDLEKLLVENEMSMSVMYTPAWVDDGDIEGGTLYIRDNEVIERQAGKIYESSEVRYAPSDGNNRIYDHISEFSGLNKIKETGRIDVQSHGLTHLDPDHLSWAKAGDRKTDSRWYHEFYHEKSNKEVAKTIQFQSMNSSKEKIEGLFKETPVALTPAGHRHDAQCDLLAYEAGYSIFSSDYTGIMKGDMLIRNWKIPSIFLYLKEPSPFASRSGYPFVGVIHDYELKEGGLNGLNNLIQKWKSGDIHQFVTLRELCLSLCLSIDAEIINMPQQVRMVLSVDKQIRDTGVHKSFAGTVLNLRLLIPEAMTCQEDQIRVTGAILCGIKRIGKNSMTFNLKWHESPTVNMDVPLIEVYDDSLITNGRSCMAT